MGFPDGSDDKESARNVGDPGSIFGLGRAPGEENGYPLQYSCLENPMDRGDWQATVREIARSWIYLSSEHFHTFSSRLEPTDHTINHHFASSSIEEIVSLIIITS